MGHGSGDGHEYRRLQERISRKVQGNPASETLMRILRLLYSPEEARLAASLPHNLTPVETLADRLRMDASELHGRLTDMAGRGVVFDLEHNGRRYVTLPPVVIGFFEFVFMRTRPDMPMRELAELFERYFTENDGAVGKAFWEGQTQFARTFVNEEALPEGDHSEVLDWERATGIVAAASDIAVATCQCRHLARHHDQDCGKPSEVCLSFNYAARSMVRNGHTRPIGKGEALAILDRCREANLVQIGDNVKRQVSFICNCCGCCCHMLRGIRSCAIPNGVVSSNWIMEVDEDRCKGCGECAKVCPVDAIGLRGAREEGSRRRLAERNAELCLGCGVCSTVCKKGAAAMRPRPHRLVTPETVFDQRIAMAIERGKLADMLFDDPERLGHRALARLIGALERSAVFRAAMASAPVKSMFLQALVRGAKKQAGDLTSLFT